MILVTLIMWAQTAPRQAPHSHPDRDHLPAGQCQDMMEMHKQQIEAMRAEVEHMKKSLAQMKANLLTIRDSNEMDRWRNNAEMWQALVDHMDRMLKEMESSQVGTTGPCALVVLLLPRQSKRNPSKFANQCQGVNLCWM